MRRPGFLRALLAAAALAIAPALAFALEEQSLLTPDGTLHVLRAGKAIDLGLAEAPPESIVIEHTSLAQDGTEMVAILPGSESYQDKRGLQLGTQFRYLFANAQGEIEADDLPNDRVTGTNRLAPMRPTWLKSMRDTHDTPGATTVVEAVMMGSVLLAGVVFLACPGAPAPGAGVLRWSVSPKILRRLGAARVRQAT